MPGATQGAKYSLGELKLPRAAWVSLGPNPFFLMHISDDKKTRYLSKLEPWVTGQKFSRKDAESILGTLVH